jgi:predicted NBD/HSP70 family sugar kinase
MYLLFDIGGNNMRFAVSGGNAEFDAPHILKTSMDFDASMAEIAALVQRMLHGRAIIGAAGGVRALNAKKTALRNQPNFPMWVDEPLHTELERVLGVPVFLENDAAMAGLGEAVYGAGKGHRIVAYLTISTGIGGARIVDQTIDASAQGFEPGLQIISGVSAGDAISSTPGYLESLVSGTAIEQRFGIKPVDIHDDHIFDTIAEELAYGINNTIVHWSPDAVVLGGGLMIKENGLPIDLIRTKTEKILRAFSAMPDIKKADLGDSAGLYGALHFAEHALRAQ